MLIDDGLQILEDDECRSLLGTHQIGRVAITLGAVPAVLPVNYVIRDGDILFATGPGLKLRAALDHTVVAFEVDDIDPVARSGWSVLVVGRAETVSEPAARQHMLEHGLQTWAPGDRHHLIRIDTDFVSGRRFGATVGEP
jgi:nitroimidazol reductase NimA-like FMN-containing flavoprotein (pyridoxamine 5'-phosphate oxidase superfamily)